MMLLGERLGDGTVPRLVVLLGLFLGARRLSMMLLAAGFAAFDWWRSRLFLLAGLMLWGLSHCRFVFLRRAGRGRT